MTVVSTRLSPKELDYLTGIASENKMRKGGSDELSLGKALNELVRWCHLNHIDINSNHNAVNDDIKKMIEQIHVAIPHLMYLTRLQTVLLSDGIPEEKITRSRAQTLDYINKTCGDLQNINYDLVRFSMNDIGLKTLPVNKDKTLWKLP